MDKKNSKFFMSGTYGPLEFVQNQLKIKLLIRWLIQTVVFRRSFFIFRGCAKLGIYTRINSLLFILEDVGHVGIVYKFLGTSSSVFSVLVDVPNQLNKMTSPCLF
uniref:Uncharacterized protein n=1 Tax=Cacopsylla melanoneura TaxID=428564 RepID=A0A8D8TTI7_9HEMI